MAIEARVEMYRRIEQMRGRPLIVYATSRRQNANGQIAADVVAELLIQLERLPSHTTKLDLLIVSDGGDPTVSWRIVSLIRERVKELSVLVPDAAFSAATLVALGANEIVMHPFGNLGPVDPQITAPKPGPNSNGEAVRFGSEDLGAFLSFARDRIGLTDQQYLLTVFEKFCDNVGPVAIGIAARGAQLSLTLSEKMLAAYMFDPTDRQKAHEIANQLNRRYFHHGYAVSRSEAKEIGLRVTFPPPEVETLMREIWQDAESELKCKEPFNPMAEVRANPACAALFAPIPSVNLPAGMPPQMVQAVFEQLAQRIFVESVPSTDFSIVHAIVESTRVASRFVGRGTIFACRYPDGQIHLNVLPVEQLWESVDTMGRVVIEPKEGVSVTAHLACESSREER